MLFRVLILFHVYSALSYQASGQTSKLRFDHLTPADGLSQSIVYDILESQQGFLWFATRDGLNRYDGHDFHVYRNVPDDSTTLSDSKTRVLFEDRAGALWVGTVEGGVNRFESSTETFTRYPLPTRTSRGNGHGWVTSITQDDTGLMWIGSYSGGLFSLDPQTGQYTSFERDDEKPANYPGDRIEDLLIDTQGRLWVADQSRLIHNTGPKGLCLFDMKMGGCTARYLADYEVEQILEDGSGRLWITASETNAVWAISLDVDTGQILEQYRLPLEASFDMQRGPDGNIWIALEGGILRLNPMDGTIQTTRYDPADPSGLSAIYIMSLLRAKSGTMWVGTSEGLDIYRNESSPFQVYRGYSDNPYGLANRPVNALLETRDGLLWLGTEEGLDRLDRTSSSIEHFLQSPQPGSRARYINRIWSLLEDRSGMIWVGTGRSGLHTFDRSTGVFSHEHGLHEAVQKYRSIKVIVDGLGIRDLFEDRKGFIWVGTQYGAGRRDPETGDYTAFPADPLDDLALSDRAVNTFFEDASGRMWIGTDYGINLYDPATNSFSRFVHDPNDETSISANVIWTITESKLTPGILWIGTIGGGLNRFDPSSATFKAYTTADGLPNNMIYGVLSDEEGNLWMTTACGLARFNPLSESFAIYHPRGEQLCDEFDLMSYHKSAYTGEMFVGDGNGFDSFYPDSVRQNTFVPPVVLTGIQIFDEARPGILASGDTITLGHRQNYFTVSFTVLDFMRGSQNQYRFRLVGYDDQWRTKDGKNPEAAYTNVPPGNYTFQVFGSNKDGVFGSEAAELHVVVVPALWQKFWFRFLLAIAVLGMIGAFLVMQKTRKQRRTMRRQADAEEVRQRLVDHEEKERVRLAHELHDGPIQGLYHVNHMLEMLAMKSNNGASATDLDAPRKAVNDLATELRNVCNELRPPMLQHFGLRASMEDSISRAQSVQPELRVSFSFDEAVETLSARTQHVVFRCVQEALNNVVQHAGATRVLIQVDTDVTQVIVKIEDDGKGFALPISRVQLARGEHLGLVGIMERAESVGGTGAISSSPKTGTKVLVKIPNAEPADQAPRSWTNRLGRWFHKRVSKSSLFK